MSSKNFLAVSMSSLFSVSDSELSMPCLTPAAIGIEAETRAASGGRLRRSVGSRTVEVVVAVMTAVAPLAVVAAVAAVLDVVIIVVAVVEDPAELPVPLSSL